MAELDGKNDPRRAALLKKAFERSKEDLIDVNFERTADLLNQDQLARALENQAELDKNLQVILELLLSENRTKRIESEKARIREYLKQLDGIIKQEKDVEARTRADDDAKRLSGEQNRIAEKTGNLAKDIKEKEEGGERKGEGEKKGEGGRGKADSGKPDEKQGKENEESKSQDGQPSDSQGEQGSQGGEGQSQEQKSPQSENPARKRLEEAKKRMQEAEQKLKEAQKQGAAEKQEQAIRELEQAKAELEEILRQLREEEIARTLAMLEGRFKKMLEIQMEVYEGTVRLDAVPEADRTHNHEIESNRLGGRELQIVAEADKTLVLLHEDGTAVAFPEALEQMRGDLAQVADRLAQAKVGQVTRSIEQDIIAALKEAIEALQKAQKDQEKKKKQSPQQQDGQPQDPPLVDVLAELKMIRALQMRVNGRTERYSKLIEGEQAEQPDLIDALRKLAERQDRIHRVTRDLQKEMDEQ
jgi:hypothetical protein